MYGRRVGDKPTEASGGQTETGSAVSLRCVVSLTPHTCEVKVLEDYRRKKSLNAFVEIGLRRRDGEEECAKSNTIMSMKKVHFNL